MLEDITDSHIFQGDFTYFSLVFIEMNLIVDMKNAMVHNQGDSFMIRLSIAKSNAIYIFG
jgi:hypothetical protein